MNHRSKLVFMCLCSVLFSFVAFKTAVDNQIQSYSLDLIEGSLNSRKYFKTNHLLNQNVSSFENNKDIRNKIVILMWTKYYNVQDVFLMNSILSGRKWDPSCCADDIIVTLERNLLLNATIVVFFHYFGNLKKEDLPDRRPEGQLWVLFGKESPSLSPPLHKFINTFNWTMSYRRDSDIWSPYGYFEPLKTPMSPNAPIFINGNIPLSDWISSKTEILACIISHCRTQSKREQYVTKLRNNSLKVDIFGGCGHQKICPRTRKSCDHDKFWHNLSSKYKFYFAAENSVCVDYITEKFWRTLELGMVPLVYGGANYTKVAPPNSFIDVANFNSSKDVAEFLIKTSNDPVKYSKYFEWRRNYKVQLTDGWGGWCTLCKLSRIYWNDPKSKLLPTKRYDNLAAWWSKERRGSKQSACKRPKFHLK